MIWIVWIVVLVCLFVWSEGLSFCASPKRFVLISQQTLFVRRNSDLQVQVTCKDYAAKHPTARLNRDPSSPDALLNLPYPVGRRVASSKRSVVEQPEGLSPASFQRQKTLIDFFPWTSCQKQRFPCQDFMWGVAPQQFWHKERRQFFSRQVLRVACCQQMRRMPAKGKGEMYPAGVELDFGTNIYWQTTQHRVRLARRAFHLLVKSIHPVSREKWKVRKAVQKDNVPNRRSRSQGTRIADWREHRLRMRFLLGTITSGNLNVKRLKSHIRSQRFYFAVFAGKQSDQGKVVLFARRWSVAESWCSRFRCVFPVEIDSVTFMILKTDCLYVGALRKWGNIISNDKMSFSGAVRVSSVHIDVAREVHSVCDCALYNPGNNDSIHVNWQREREKLCGFEWSVWKACTRQHNTRLQVLAAVDTGENLGCRFLMIISFIPCKVFLVNHFGRARHKSVHMQLFWWKMKSFDTGAHIPRICVQVFVFKKTWWGEFFWNLHWSWLNLWGWMS